MIRQSAVTYFLSHHVQRHNYDRMLFVEQLTYYHSDDGGQLFVDGKNPFRRYHIGPCSSFSSVLFGGMTIQMSAGKLTVSCCMYVVTLYTGIFWTELGACIKMGPGS